MNKMDLIQYVVGPISTNCYFAVNKDTNKVVIIDPGDEASQLIDRITLKSLEPVAILLTHGHFDHVKAAAALSEEYGIDVYAGRDESKTLADPRINQSANFDGAGEVYRADVLIDDNEVLNLAGFKIRVIFTPGHTVGGVCYYFEDEGSLFSGDTLFFNSVGRTDFEGGSQVTLIKGIKTRLMTLDDDIIVLPGHGARTTIGEERMHNPYL